MRADVVALAHALRRVVVLPEDLEQVLVAGRGRVENDTHGLSVASLAGARLLVGGIGCVPALVAHRRGPDAGLLPERLLLAPEAAQCELSDLEAVGIWTSDRRAEDAMGSRVGQDWLAPAGQRVLSGRHRRLAAVEQVHGKRLRQLGSW